MPLLDRALCQVNPTVEAMVTTEQKEAGPVRERAHEPIDNLIKRARERRGMSQYALAEVLVSLSGNDGVSRAEVARWERGKRIPGPYWRRWLSVVLDLPCDRLGTAARLARRRRRAASRQARRSPSRS